jgi:peptidoglycan-associated lipoprotein
MKNSSLLLVSALVFAISSIGCGGKQSQTGSSGSGGGGDSASAVRKEEKATGDLREALLQLRRVHFARDTDELLPESKTAIQEASSRLRGHKDVHVYIDGHTDVRGTTEYNLGLGERRAKSVADYLERLGIAKERLHVVTFGEERPWVKGSDDAANSKNRRAEFRLMRGDVRLVLEVGVQYDDEGKRQ